MTHDETADEIAIGKTDTSLTVRRTFDASPERLFRAFTDADELEQWYSHGGMTWTVNALEPEPGGSLLLSMQHDEDRFDIEGEYVEVVENERIVHTWYVGRVTIELKDVDGGTEVVLIHDGLPERDTVEQHATGWTGALENLADLLEEA